MFNLVHDDTYVYAEFEAVDTAVVGTIYTLEQFATEKEMQDRIAALALVDYPDAQDA